ncbi:hypothetical protein AMTRI_Chr02g256080 [Amborella trichopoda]
METNSISLQPHLGGSEAEPLIIGGFPLRPRTRRRLRSPSPIVVEDEEQSELEEEEQEVEGEEETDDEYEGEEVENIDFNEVVVGELGRENGVNGCDGSLRNSGAMAIQDEEESECNDNCKASQKTAGDLDAFSCPICMDLWTTEGTHRICCLPCGHLYGQSCIEKWIQQCGRNNGKCPQCKKKCMLKDIRKLYAPHIAVANGELQQEVISLRDENEFLKLQKESLLGEIQEYKRKQQADKEALEKQRAECLKLQTSLASTQTMLHGFANDQRECQMQRLSGDTVGSQSCFAMRGPLLSSFIMKEEFRLNGARIIDMDAFSQVLLVSHSESAMGGTHFLTKRSLLALSESERVHLPPNTGTVRDLQISPPSMVHPGRLALLASMGKKLSIVSLESNNVVIKYDLQVPAWSCTWNLDNPSQVYAGLQNGSLLMFDLRQTAQAVEVIYGLSSQPIHTVHSLTPALFHNSTYNARSLLSASAIGPCLWRVGVTERPCLVPGFEDQGVCISLAHCNSTKSTVATFRPKVSMSNDYALSQPMGSPSQISWREGSHFLLKMEEDGSYQRQGIMSCNVSSVRMPKSAIITLEDNRSLFAYGDEESRRVCVWDMQSLDVVSRLRPHQDPVLDLKFSNALGMGLLGCVSENMLQIYSCNI